MKLFGSRSALASAGLLALLAASARCAGTLEDPERFTDAGSGAAPNDAAASADAAIDVASHVMPEASACPDVPSGVFLPNCTSAGCHNSKDKEQGLDLESANLVARLINVPSSEGAGVLIDPSAPAQSVLYTKLTTNPPFGAQMPTKGALDDVTVACVLAWITEVASAPTDSDAGTSPDAAPESDAAIAGDAHDG